MTLTEENQTAKFKDEKDEESDSDIELDFETRLEGLGAKLKSTKNINPKMKLPGYRLKTANGAQIIKLYKESLDETEMIGTDAMTKFPGTGRKGHTTGVIGTAQDEKKSISNDFTAEEVKDLLIGTEFPKSDNYEIYQPLISSLSDFNKISLLEMRKKILDEAVKFNIPPSQVLLKRFNESSPGLP